MENIIANIDDIRFDIEIALEEQLGIQPLPFPGMDSIFICINIYLQGFIF